MATIAARPNAATVLVVDDEAENRAVARTCLEDAGYRVVLAANGAEALSAFETGSPDCILLDVRIAPTDGFEVCVRIRERPAGRTTPIIFLTARRDVDTFDRALRAGGTDFLAKPYAAHELIIRVASALKLRTMSEKVGGQVAILKSQCAALQRLQLQKERLAAFVVHDLKNPVNSIDLHAQFLLRCPELSPDARESAKQIHAEAGRLTTMLLNLLDVSRGDEGVLTLRTSIVNLPDLARVVAADLELMAKNLGVEIASAMDAPPLRADADLLRRTLTNLVENALHHAPAGSVVRLVAAAREEMTELRVTDAGSGVPRGLADRIFDPFVQLDEESDDAPKSRVGRGLGLTFCRAVAEAHGGRIWVEDAAPGATFCLSLPHGPCERSGQILSAFHPLHDPS